MSDQADQPAPFEFEAPLTVCLDVRHPQAYLALGPVQHLADELDLAVDWLPFPVTPPKGPPATGDDRGSRHRRARARYQAREIELYAEVQGLSIERPFRGGDATAAALAHLWLRGRAPAALPRFLRQLFDGFWSDTLAAADPAALARLLQSAGHDGDAFVGYAAAAGPDELASLRERLLAAGVFSVPSLVVEGEVFLGRAHLPMVRWLLTGQSGPPPI